MIRVFAIACFFVVVAALHGGQKRIWHYTDGRSFSAEYRWSSKVTLYLRDKNGKEMEVALGALSNADLEYVRGLRSKLTAKGIVFSAPLTWEEYRSKNFTASEAQKAGYFPLDSRPTTEGSLRLEFHRFGPAPKLAPNQKVVLRMTTTRSRGSGTSSTIQVGHSGKIVGATSGVASNKHFDITLSPVVFQGAEKIILDLRCGSDTVYIRTRKSGAGPRLLIVEQIPE
ncbi:MAG: hypothetical protein VCA73_12200 [Roseibacillus sp.]